ncbi:MAG: dTMP kinase [bacterium]|jgi:dTMP kinase
MFITFEGIDGCGKSSQLELVKEWFAQKKIDFVATREPGGTTIGKGIREVLLDPANTSFVSEAELLLYLADRVQHIHEFIQPALAAKKVVLCDRYHDATVAYQGGGRQLDIQWTEVLTKRLILSPDLTIWFDVPVEVGQKRIQKREQEAGIEKNRLDLENIAFHQRVADAYQTIYLQNPHRVVRIDAQGSLEETLQNTIQALQQKFFK